jgi:hypothetical protein
MMPNSSKRMKVSPNDKDRRKIADMGAAGGVRLGGSNYYA